MEKAARLASFGLVWCRVFERREPRYFFGINLCSRGGRRVHVSIDACELRVRTAALAEEVPA